ncbi:hypothetical protein LINGRAHAP2_LOCUS10284, partial [Linum grandiflorum]
TEVFSAAELQFSTGVRCVLNPPLYKGPKGKSVKSNYRHERILDFHPFKNHLHEQINTTNMDLHTRKIREVQTT